MATYTDIQFPFRREVAERKSRAPVYLYGHWLGRTASAKPTIASHPVSQATNQSAIGIVKQTFAIEVQSKLEIILKLFMQAMMIGWLCGFAYCIYMHIACAPPQHHHHHPQSANFASMDGRLVGWMDSLVHGTWTERFHGKYLC